MKYGGGFNIGILQKSSSIKRLSQAYSTPEKKIVRKPTSVKPSHTKNAASITKNIQAVSEINFKSPLSQEKRTRQSAARMSLSSKRYLKI